MTWLAGDGGAGDALTYPPDDPETVRGVVSRLVAVGSDTADAEGRVLAAGGRAPAVWDGVAEGRCAAEVRALGSLLAAAGRQLGTACTALQAYARDLDDARCDVDTLRRRRDEALGEADPEIRGARLALVYREHDRVLDDVRRSAAVAGVRIGDAAGALRGRSAPGAAGARHAVLSLLPMLDEQEAGAAADEAAHWLRASSYDDRWLATVGRFEEWADDPWFAARLLTELGPEELLRIPYFMSALVASQCGPDNLDPMPSAQQKELHARVERVLRFLGATLAGGTRTGAATSVGEQWVRDLQHDASGSLAGSTMGWFSVGQLLRHGRFDTRFLLDMAAAADAADRSTDWRVWRMTAPMSTSMAGYVEPGTGAGGWDPMVGVLTAVSRDRDATLAFLTPDRLDRLLTHRGGWGDDGAALGGLLVTAAGVRRDAAAAEVTARMVRDLAAHGGQLPDGLRRGVAGVLGAQAADVAFSIYADGRPPHAGTWTRPGNLPWLGADQPPAAVLSAADLAVVLRAVSADAEAYRTLVDAQAAWIKLSIESAARLPGDRAQVVAGVEAAASDGATVLGFLTTAHDAGASAQARAQDAAHNRLVDLAAAGAGLVPVPGGKLVEFGVHQLLDGIAGELHSDSLAAAQHAVATDSLASRTFVVDSVATAMTRAGLFPDTHDPRAWLAAQPPAVRAHPFVDDAGRLLAPDRLDGDAWWNYAQWLHDPAGASSTIGVTAQRVDDRYAAARRTAEDLLR